MLENKNVASGLETILVNICVNVINHFDASKHDHWQFINAIKMEIHNQTYQYIANLIWSVFVATEQPDLGWLWSECKLVLSFDKVVIILRTS